MKVFGRAAGHHDISFFWNFFSIVSFTHFFPRPYRRLSRGTQFHSRRFFRQKIPVPRTNLTWMINFGLPIIYCDINSTINLDKLFLLPQCFPVAGWSEGFGNQNATAGFRVQQVFSERVDCFARMAGKKG